MSLCKTVAYALKEAISLAKFNSKISNVGKKVEAIAKENGFTVLRNLGGHGVGHSLHESPEFIPNFYNKNDKRKFLKNQVVAIEPFISNGANYVREGEDKWTLFHPKFYCVQKEHTIMITKNMPYIFTTPTKQLA